MDWFPFNYLSPFYIANTDDDNAKKVGNWFGGLALDSAIDGVSGGALDGIKTCGQAIKVVKTGCEVYSAATDETFKHYPSPDFLPNSYPKMTLFMAKNIKNLF